MSAETVICAAPTFLLPTAFPKMAFKSTGIKKVGENKYKITGDLTMKGATKSVTLDGEFGGVLKTERGTRAGF